MEIGKHYKSGPLSTLGSQFSRIYQHPAGTLQGSVTEVKQRDRSRGCAGWRL